MMKLRHLFHNDDLARMLLANWEYDPESLDMFRYFRISANAIYPFKRDGELHFLRFCPTTEKPKENLLAELDFIGYLRSRDYPALEPVRSKSGAALLQKTTPWGAYYVSVFKRVPGEQISNIPLSNEIVFALGSALGHLHRLSSEYSPASARRWTHADVLDWVAQVLPVVSAGSAVFAELALLRDYFGQKSSDRGNYGLIHYDFELDNVFYDAATRKCSVIDFDDAMYHWYAMDIEQALDSLAADGQLTESDFRQGQAVFLDGYRSQFAIHADQLAALPVFRRFANLYGYARIARAMQEAWENEPEWLVQLRLKLHRALVVQSASFGSPIHHEKEKR